MTEKAGNNIETETFEHFKKQHTDESRNNPHRIAVFKIFQNITEIKFVFLTDEKHYKRHCDEHHHERKIQK